jgi:hypothetical protein
MRELSSAILLILLSTGVSPGQSSKYEIGAQFSVIHMLVNETVSLPCTPRQPLLGGSVCNPVGYPQLWNTRAGIGLRLGYAVTRHLTLEPEFNLFPQKSRTERDTAIAGFVGVKAGKSFQRLGAFVQVKPGFFTNYNWLRFSPPFDFSMRTESRFALKLGGGVEFFLRNRWVPRIDINDVLVFEYPGVETSRDKLRHVPQFSASLGYRF